MRGKVRRETFTTAMSPGTLTLLKHTLTGCVLSHTPSPSVAVHCGRTLEGTVMRDGKYSVQQVTVGAMIVLHSILQIWSASMHGSQPSLTSTRQS